MASGGGSTGQGDFYLWMPYCEELSQDAKQAVITEILRVGHSITGGDGLTGNVPASNIRWQTNESLFHENVIITSNTDGSVTLDFSQQSDWTKFWYGGFSFNNVNIDGTLVNTMKTGSLKITKLVERTDGVDDTSGTFTFKVQLPAEYDGRTVTVGGESETFAAGEGENKVSITVDLTHNVPVTISNLPCGVQVEITETTTDGYSTKWSGDHAGQSGADVVGATVTTQAITAGDANTIEVTCTNTTGAVLPSTGGTGVGLYLAFGSLLTLGAGLLLIQRRRKEGSDAV